MLNWKKSFLLLGIKFRGHAKEEAKQQPATWMDFLTHRQPKLNIREPLNYKDLYGNTTDLCKMVETNIVLSIKST